MKRLILLVAAMGLMLATISNSQEIDMEAELAMLPDGAGKEEVFYTCVVCHSIRTVVQQKLSKNMWDETLDWMVDEQGMPELDDEDRTVILNYLSEHVSPD